jgi:hypothetical protein
MRLGNPLGNYRQASDSAGSRTRRLGVRVQHEFDYWTGSLGERWAQKSLGPDARMAQ